MLPFEVVQDLRELTEKWKLKSLGQTIVDLMNNYTQLIRRYNESQKNLTELKNELIKWRERSNESKAKRGKETSK